MTQGKLLVLAGAVLGAAACAHHTQAAARPAADSVDVGYGAQPKDKVLGAVTALSPDDMKARPLRIEELLRGKVAGLEVIQNGNAVTFRIRGAASISRDQEPLVIV